MAGLGGDELTPFVLRDAEIEGLKEGAEREEKQAGAGAYGYVFKNKQRVEGTETEISDLKKQIHELELARNEAVGDAAAAKMEAKIYEEATEEISALKQECNRLKVEHARNEARLQHEVERLRGEVETSQTVVAHLREVSQQHSEQLQRRLKASEANLQAQVSQSKYRVGDKEKVIAQLQEDKRKLEEEVSSKMQQVKQYKKQADSHLEEIRIFRDAHQVQKMQIEQMAEELSTLGRQVKVLQHENAGLKARERYSNAGQDRVGVVSLEADRKKIAELENMVKPLQTQKAILQSPPQSSQAPPTSSSPSPGNVPSCRDTLPFDPNLECPKCERKFRLGQIQFFREHVANCKD